MAETGLNNAQITGLLGTTTANLLSSYNQISQAQLASAAAGLQAGSLIANANLQIGSSILNANFQSNSSIANARFQEGAAIANAELAAGRGLAQADLLASDLRTSALLATTQTGIESDLQLILREQQAQDLEYQSQRQEINADIIGTQIELSRGEGEARKKEILRTLNKSDVNLTMMAVAQGRSGATVANLREQGRANADIDIELSKLAGEVQRAGLAIEQAGFRADSKISALASQSTEAASILEQQSAQFEIDYLNNSATQKINFIQSSSAAEAEFGKMLALTEGNRYVEAATTQAAYNLEITKLQNDYTRESSLLTAQTIKSQAKAAKNVAIVSGITGAVSSLGTTYSTYKAIA